MGGKKGYLSTDNGILPRLLPHIDALFFLSLYLVHTHSHYIYYLFLYKVFPMNKWWRIIDRFPTKLAAALPRLEEEKKHTHSRALYSRYYEKVMTADAEAAVFYGRIDYCDCIIYIANNSAEYIISNNVGWLLNAFGVRVQFPFNSGSIRPFQPVRTAQFVHYIISPLLLSVPSFIPVFFLFSLREYSCGAAVFSFGCLLLQTWTPSIIHRFCHSLRRTPSLLFSTP